MSARVDTWYARAVNAFSATRAGTWVVRHVAARVDPVLFVRTNGRVTITGIPTLPMLTLTTGGRRTGQPRAVQLAYVADGEDLLVVASAMGQAHHPAWSYNLAAAGGGSVQLPGRRVDVVAKVLSEAEKEAAWPRITAAIPQMRVYVRRTDRDIRVFRLTPTGPVPGRAAGSTADPT